MTKTRKSCGECPYWDDCGKNFQVSECPARSLSNTPSPLAKDYEKQMRKHMDAARKDERNRIIKIIKSDMKRMQDATKREVKADSWDLETVNYRNTRIDALQLILDKIK
jgi:hypothetical protein